MKGPNGKSNKKSHGKLPTVNHPFRRTSHSPGRSDRQCFALQQACVYEPCCCPQNAAAWRHPCWCRPFDPAGALCPLSFPFLPRYLELRVDVRVHDGLQRITRLLNEEARCCKRRHLCSLQDVDMNCDLVSYRVNLPGYHPRRAITGHHRKRV